MPWLVPLIATYLWHRPADDHPTIFSHLNPGIAAKAGSADDLQPTPPNVVQIEIVNPVAVQAEPRNETLGGLRWSDGYNTIRHRAERGCT